MINTYKKAPVYQEVRGRETFQFLSGAWDVDKAKELTAGHKPSTFTPKPWADMFLGPDLEDGQDYDKIGGGFIRVNEGHALSERCDLNNPVLVVNIISKNEPKGNFMVIDGWNRVWKARHLGVEHLPFIMLTAEEEKACRLRGCWDKGVRQRKPAARKTKVSAK